MNGRPSLCDQSQPVIGFSVSEQFLMATSGILPALSVPGQVDGTSGGGCLDAPAEVILTPSMRTERATRQSRCCRTYLQVREVLPGTVTASDRASQRIAAPILLPESDTARYPSPSLFPTPVLLSPRPRHHDIAARGKSSFRPQPTRWMVAGGAGSAAPGCNTAASASTPVTSRGPGRTMMPSASIAQTGRPGSARAAMRPARPRQAGGSRRAPPRPGRVLPRRFRASSPRRTAHQGAPRPAFLRPRSPGRAPSARQ
jgi:hypothetical protein